MKSEGEVSVTGKTVFAKRISCLFLLIVFCMLSGPASWYDREDVYPAARGTELRIFFVENGYAYAEYTSGTDLCRMWFPVDQITIY